MSDTNVSDSNRQAYDGKGAYTPTGRAAAAMNAGKSAGAGSSVVNMDGTSGSSPKGDKAQSELKPNATDKRVDNTNNPAGDSKSAVGGTAQTGTDELGNTTKIADRKV